MCDSGSQSSRFDEVRVFIRKTFCRDEQLLIIIGKTKKEKDSSFPKTYSRLIKPPDTSPKQYCRTHFDPLGRAHMGWSQSLIFSPNAA